MLSSPNTPDTVDRRTHPLTGLAVIELQAIGPVPFAGGLLRQLGARVTRVVPPDDRGLGVAIDPRFDVSNLGKDSWPLDLKTPAGLAALDSRLASADVLLEGFRPGVLERLGLAPAELLARHPRLVIGRLSGWGSQGPLAARAGHDINYLALTGVLHAIGKAEQPIPPLNLVADYGGGAMHLVAGVLARLVGRGIDGLGGLVETSIAAGTVGLLPLAYSLLADARWQLPRESNLLDGGAPFYRTYRCRDDRFIAIGPLEGKFFRELLEVCELTGRLDPRTQYERSTWPDMARAFADCFVRRDRDDWAQRAEGRDCCLSPVLDFMEAARHPQSLANDWHIGQPFVQPAPAIRFKT